MTKVKERDIQTYTKTETSKILYAQLLWVTF